MKVNEEYLGKLVRGLRTEFLAERLLGDILIQLYLQEHLIDAPQGAEVVSSALAADIIEAARGIFAGEPIIEVHIPGASEANMAKGIKMQQWLNALFPIMEHEADEDSFELQKFDALVQGIGWCKVLPATGYWRDYPSRLPGQSAKAYLEETDKWKRHHRIPIVCRHVPAQAILWRRTSAGLHEVVEEMEVPVYDLLERFDLPGLAGKVHGNGYREADLVTLLEYANREEVVYAVEYATAKRAGEPVIARPRETGDLSGGVIEIARRWKHGLGQVPYVMMRLLPTSSTRPGARYMSLLFHMRKSIPYLDRLLSQKATAIRTWAWPKVVFTAGAQTRAMRGDKFTFTLDLSNLKEALLLYETEKVGFLTWEGNPPEIEEMYNVVRSTIDRLGPGPIMHGAGPSGATGYATALLQSAAGAKYDPMAKHMADARRKAAELAILCVQQIQEPVELLSQTGQWLELGPKDIPDDYLIRAELKLRRTTDLASMGYLALALTQPRGPDREGLMPEDWGRRVLLQDDDPIATRKELDKQKIRRQLEPLLLQAAMKDSQNIVTEEEQVGMADLEGLPPELLGALAARGFPVPPGMALGQPLGPGPGGPNMGALVAGGEGLAPTPQRRPGSRVAQRPPGARPGQRRPRPVGPGG